MPTPATPPALTLAQESAVDLLAAGKTDTDTAAALGLHRVTVTRWRLYSPDFRAALADRRAAVWGAAADRLRALLPAALDAVAAVLADPAAPNRVPVALALLKLAGPLPTPPADPPDADALVRRVVDDERDRARDRDDDNDSYFGLPGYDAHARAVRRRLARLADPPDDVARPALPPATGSGLASADRPSSGDAHDN